MSTESHLSKSDGIVLMVLALVFYAFARIIEKMARKAWGLVKTLWKNRPAKTTEPEVVDA